MLLKMYIKFDLPLFNINIQFRYAFCATKMVNHDLFQKVPSRESEGRNNLDVK